MDWVILVLFVPLYVFAILILRKLDRVEERQRITLKQIHDGRARQGQTAHRYASHGAPQVDARAVTTRRDTADLPAAGRMSTAVHRPRRTFDGENTNS